MMETTNCSLGIIGCETEPKQIGRAESKSNLDDGVVGQIVKNGIFRVVRVEMEGKWVSV